MSRCRPGGAARFDQRCRAVRRGCLGDVGVRLGWGSGGQAPARLIGVCWAGVWLEQYWTVGVGAGGYLSVRSSGLSRTSRLSWGRWCAARCDPRLGGARRWHRRGPGVLTKGRWSFLEIELRPFALDRRVLGRCVARAVPDGRGGCRGVLVGSIIGLEQDVAAVPGTLVCGSVGASIGTAGGARRRLRRTGARAGRRGCRGDAGVRLGAIVPRWGQVPRLGQHVEGPEDRTVRLATITTGAVGSQG
jgi:hypothetical protein